MPRFLIQAGSAAFALSLLSFVGTAGAAPRPALAGTTGLMVLAGDDENAEVKNFLDPEADNGTPKDNTGAANTPPREGEHAAEPHGEGDSSEKALESTVGDDGINAIQQDSIPK